jgi:diguanylate cyclase
MEEPKHAETEVVPGFPGEPVNEREGKEGTDDQVLVIARKAILTMSNHRIPMTPDNYRIWFEYLVGSNAALREEMDRCLKEGVRFSDQLNEDLCRK